MRSDPSGCRCFAGLSAARGDWEPGCPVSERIVSRVRRSWALIAVGLGLGGIVLSWFVRPARAGDTGPLMDGTEAIARCLARLDLVSCEDGEAIGPWPVLQHLPDLAAHTVGLSDGARVRVLATLSVVGIVAAVWAAFVTLRRTGSPEWRWGFLLVVVSGPALAYGNATWGEMLAAGLLTLFVAAGLLRVHPVLFGAAAFGAGLTKETGYPFVVALGLIALVLSRRWHAGPLRRHLLLGSAGILAAVVGSSLLNVMRFGTPRNAYYLDPGLRTQSPEWFLELVAGLFVAPNGGIVFFWPTAVVVFALLTLTPVVRALRGDLAWRAAWVAVALLVVVTGLVGGLAAWWAPFGWWAWGPRLSLPWVFPLVLLALAAFGPAMRRGVLVMLGSNGRLAVASTLTVIVSLPHVGLLWRPETVGEFFFLTVTDVCPGGGPPPTAAYYACLREELWSRHPIWLDALRGLAGWEGLATVLAVSLVVAGCLVLLRQEAAARIEGGAEARRSTAMSGGPSIDPGPLDVA